MSYHLKPARSLEGDVRRIAAEQIDKAIAELTDAARDRHEAIHDARKRFKKLRGLLRLVRTGNEAFFHEENARYRDVGRRLSAVRDRTALIESLDALARHYEEVATSSFDVLRAALEAKRQAAIEAEGDLGAAIGATVGELRSGRARLDGLILKTGGRADDRDLAAAGLARTYADARRALRRSRRSRDAADLHELRKRVKDHGMHLKLAEPVWPEVIAPMRRAAEQVADDLGTDHDYAVLRAEMAADPASFGEAADLAVVLALTDRRQSELQHAALEAAARLLVEKPGALAARMKRLHRLSARDMARDPKAPVEAPEAERRRASP